MSSDHPNPQSFERRRWLIAVFDSEARARRVADDAQQHGTQNRSIRIGSSLDVLASIVDEMHEETGPARGGQRGTAEPIPRVHQPAARARTAEQAAHRDRRHDPRLARHRAGSAFIAPRRTERVDVFGAGGHLISTLLTNDPGADGTLDDIAQHVHDESDPD